MQIEKTDNKTVVYLTGRIDSIFPDATKDELFELAKNTEGILEINLKGVNYVSSAGLRLFLKIKQEKKDKFILTHMASDVYEIFEITGFTSLLNIEKEPRNLSIDKCEIIGRGGNGTVYKCGTDEIVKVYEDRTPLEDIKREREYAKKAFLAGVPTAISFDIVNVDGKTGIVFENLKATTFSKLLMNDPENREKYELQFAKLLKEIHTTNVSGEDFPETKNLYLNIADRALEFYSEKEISEFKRLLNAIPDRNSIVHGDFNSNNVMMQDGELMLIDMAEISKGNPIYDLMNIYFVHVLNITLQKGAVQRFLQLSDEISEELWNTLVRSYFPKATEEDIIFINQSIRRLSYFRAGTLPVLFRNIVEEGTVDTFVGGARQNLLPYIDESIEMIKKLDKMLDM